MKLSRALWIFGFVAGAFAASNTRPNGVETALPGPSLASAYQNYRLPLSQFSTPSSAATGLILKVRVDGGPALRLVLDSGAQHLTLTQRAAVRSGHRGGVPMDVAGAGDQTRVARMDMAAQVETGGVTFRQCPLVILGGELLEGADGVIPLSLFSGFLVRLDVPGHTLELQPYPTAAQADPAFIPVTVEQNLLFVPGALEKAHQGYLLLDTGSSFNVISKTAAAALGSKGGAEVALEGGAGAVKARALNRQVAFHFPGGRVDMDPVMALDLEEMSARNRLNVAGVIGYPALADSVVTVNYREALVRIERR